MANEQEVAFKKAEKKFNDLSKLKVNTSTGRYTFDGKSLTAAEYTKAVNDARIERDNAKKLFDEAKSKRTKETKRVSGEKQKQQKELDKLKRDRQILQNEINNLSDDIRRGDTSSISGKDISLERKQELINDKATRIRQIDIALGVLEPEGPRSPTSADAAARRAMGTQAAATTTAAQTPATKPRTVKTTKDKKGKETVIVDGEKVVVGSEQWKTIIQEEFGGLWDVYNGNADVKAVIDKSVKEGWFNDETKLGAALQSTNWYRTTEQSARQYAIRLSSDPATVEDDINVRVENLRTYANENGLSLDDATLRRLATNQLKFGWSDIQSANAVGSEAVALAQAGGAQGMADLRQGATGRKLRETARAFAQKPSDSDIDQWVAEIMTGKKSEKQWEDLMRNSAKVQFRSLTPALDRGETVEQATYAYVRQADQTLGSVMDISQIDWSNDKWNKALNYKDEKTGENRPMDLWEWNKYLRTLPEWQETDQAKQAYRNVAYSLAQGFGKMA